jgi:hypothetical protein
MLSLIVAEYAFRLTFVVRRMDGRYGAKSNFALADKITVKSD